MSDHKPNDKLTLRDFYEQYWHCRDFEIKNLWQRSVFLGTFLVLCFTGYGVFFSKAFLEENSFVKLINKFMEPSYSLEIKHIIAMILAFIGVVFSRLWIVMAKASKAWVEVYEQAIIAVEKKMTEGSDIEGIAGFGYTNLKDYAISSNPKFDRNLLSQKGGSFSPSKINIIIGQVACWIWMYIFLGHLICLGLSLFMDKTTYNWGLALVSSFILLFFMIFCSFAFANKQLELVKFDYNSSNLNGKDPGNISISSLDILKNLYFKEIYFLEKNVVSARLLDKNIVEKENFYAEKNVVYYVYEIRNSSLKIDVFVIHNNLSKIYINVKNKGNSREVYSEVIICKDNLYQQIRDAFVRVKEIMATYPSYK